MSEAAREGRGSRRPQLTTILADKRAASGASPRAWRRIPSAVWTLGLVSLHGHDR